MAQPDQLPDGALMVLLIWADLVLVLLSELFGYLVHWGIHIELTRLTHLVEAHLVVAIVVVAAAGIIMVYTVHVVDIVYVVRRVSAYCYFWLQ